MQVTRKIKRTLMTNKATPAMAQRHQWTKFGQEAGKKPGADKSTTSLGSESMRIKLTVGADKEQEKQDEKNEAAKVKAELGGKKVSCRLCQGDHFTARCPYKDTLGSTDDAAGNAAGGPGDDDLGAGGDGVGAATGAGAGGAGGKYVPPSMRAGARGGGETMNGPRNRDDLPTLRVTNLAEETEEEDLWGIFGRFQTRGRISRIYIGRDQEGLCRGFAFVSFEFKEDAEKAMAKVDGLPFSHLILSCTWSVPKEKA